MRRIQVTITRALQRNSDLLGLWLVLVIAQHYVPVTHFLARDDLLPWMVLSLSLGAFLRGGRFGQGPHPMLTPRIANRDKWLRRAGSAAIPWALMYVYDAAGALDPAPLASAVGSVIGVMVLMSMGPNHGRTAWNPTRGLPFLPAALGGVGILGVVAGLGAGRALFPEYEILSALGPASVVGGGFLAVGLVAARIQNTRQRKASGRKDGQPYRVPMFSGFLATVGPSVSCAVVLWAVSSLVYSQAYVLALLIVVWCGVVWPKPGPIMVSCVLHEVKPIGGADPSAQDIANPFDAPPSGALRFSPLSTKRTLVMHPWLVPVKSSRIAELDDPIRPLWEQRNPMLPDHVLGTAAFEPDPLTKQDQWETITIRLKGQEDTTSVKGDSKAGRIVVLRAYPPPGASTRPTIATYRWDGSVPEDSIQILDATTQQINLRDGDVLVLSQEGVAQAFEIEIGAPVFRVADGVAFRPPQLEDYVEQ